MTYYGACCQAAWHGHAHLVERLLGTRGPSRAFIHFYHQNIHLLRARRGRGTTIKAFIDCLFEIISGLWWEICHTNAVVRRCGVSMALRGSAVSPGIRSGWCQQFLINKYSRKPLTWFCCCVSLCRSYTNADMLGMIRYSCIIYSCIFVYNCT